ncbi:putative neugrin-like protein DDB_G0288135 [Neocloeon triangulifer]|uniref:putative neugrin-like protein DDB_G0288135 n=1 Tax=Neocloeon triangulifer TaxID=2078957 RepID=UPI00286F4500|nr:putative neugrin-like protein DDB_G0288135 [Neocloeon triangulifer]
MLRIICTARIFQAHYLNRCSRFTQSHANAARKYADDDDKKLPEKQSDLENKIIYKGNFKRRPETLEIPAAVEFDSQERNDRKFNKFKGNFKRDQYLKHEDFAQKHDRMNKENNFFEDDRKYSKRQNYSRQRDEDDDFDGGYEGDCDIHDPRQVSYMRWLENIRKFKETQRTPNFLKWETKEKIRSLHNENPEEWNLEKLASNYPISTASLKQLLKNKWTPRSINLHDEVAEKNWNSFREGKIAVADKFLRAHLMSFIAPQDRIKLNEMFEEQEAVNQDLKAPLSWEKPQQEEKPRKVLQIHRDGLGQSLTNMPKTDEEVHSYEETIVIPKHKFKEGATYRVKDCYYHSDGTFLYRVPGMDQANS